MTKHPETTDPGDSLAKAKEIMDVAVFRRLPVVKDDKIVGMLTERNLRAHSSYMESTKVNAVMSSRHIGKPTFDGSGGHSIDAAAQGRVRIERTFD